MNYNKLFLILSLFLFNISYGISFIITNTTELNLKFILKKISKDAEKKEEVENIGTCLKGKSLRFDIDYPAVISFIYDELSVDFHSSYMIEKVHCDICKLKQVIFNFEIKMLFDENKCIDRLQIYQTSPYYPDEIQQCPKFKKELMQVYHD